MDEVLKVLKQIVSSFSDFGTVPKPVKVCIGLFSGVFAFGLIFVYAGLDKKQAIFLAIALGLMVVVTGIYYLWKGLSAKKPDQEFWSEASGEKPASGQTQTGAAQSSSSSYSARETEWAPVGGQRSAAAQPRPERPQEPVRGRGETLTLLDLVDPLFQYVCRLNRAARRAPGSKSGETTSFLARTAAGIAAPQPIRAAGLDEVVARSEIKALLEDILSKAGSDLRLAQQARRIELPLVFFVDSMISESKLPFAAQWNQNRLAYDRQELAGDEKFFDLLDENMKENGEDAAERLAVFYICIGLGFTGIYFKQPELLRKTMLGIAPRIRHLVENDQAARLCPEAYQCLDTRDLVQPPGSRMVLMGLLFACCTLAVMVSYIIMYRQASAHLNHSIEEVLQQDLAIDSSK